MIKKTVLTFFILSITLTFTAYGMSNQSAHVPNQEKTIGEVLQEQIYRKNFEHAKALVELCKQYGYNVQKIQLRPEHLDEKSPIGNRWLMLIGELKKLEELDLSNCKALNHNMLYPLLPLRDTLITLRMANCENIDNNALSFLAQFQSLRILDVGGCPLVTDGGMQFITTNMGHLTMVHIKGTSITNARLRELNGTHKIRIADRSTNEYLFNNCC